ncbi:MAG: transglycosylase SLT domain-containing protein [Comamonadaceae bacterium]|nr:transglycosylase SLT domain-containing protein [Burkholderiales bacterium]MEB2349056.1 transglycosylase SLT domain-containing protein [Comamonadaceae bacterium]
MVPTARRRYSLHMQPYLARLARASLAFFVLTGYVVAHAQGGGSALGGHGEPPAVMRLLDQGYAAEFRGNRAAAQERYCTAAREGSLEGQYRLGRLLWLTGAPADHAVAATLLALAVQRGHEKARVLLAGEPSGNQLPDCLKPSVSPAKPAPEAVVPAEVVERYVAGLSPAQRRQARLVQRLAPRFAVDPRLALAIVKAESNFDPLALSARNAQGLMQLIPETAERYGVRDVWNAEQNTRGGLAHLRWLLQRFEGDVALVSAAYNAGAGAVERYGGVPPFAETREYVKRVLGFYRSGRHVAPDTQTLADARR